MPSTNVQYTPINTSESTSTTPRRPRIGIPRLRPTCLALSLFFSSVPLILLILSLVVYITPGSGHMRPCLPFSLSRISSTAHSKLTCPAPLLKGFVPPFTATTLSSTTTRPYSSIPTPDIVIKPSVPTSAAKMTEGKTTANPIPASGETEMGRLAGFLESQKSEFLADLSAGKGKGWILVMGNEAGGMSIPWTELIRYRFPSISHSLRSTSFFLTRSPSYPTLTYPFFTHVTPT